MEEEPTASETLIRRSKRARVSIATGPAVEKHDPAGGSSDQSTDELERGSGDGALDDFEQAFPRVRKKRNLEGSSSTFKANQSLIEVIKGNGKLIPQTVKHWVEQYERDQKTAMVELLMMLFEACGAKYQLREDFLDETDVDDVVFALVNLARRHPPRVYRLVASMVGLQLVTSFISVAKTLGSQRETTQRQLNAEKKKRNESPLVESLNKRLSKTHGQITVIEEMMRKIFTGLFVHRYRDIDPNIRISCIESLGVWIVSYPSLFLQDLYLKYLGWTLNDKISGVRKASIHALQNLYEGDDNVPSLSLFTERFLNRMVELANDIDVSVAVAAIGLLKQLLRHQLLSGEDLSPLYDLLVDEPSEIRHAVGDVVYDHLIAQKFSSSRSRGSDGDTSEVLIGRMLQILREFSAAPILCSYVIDDIWDYMEAMKDWKCIVSMLLDENPSNEVTDDVHATNLVRLLYASARKAVGERIVPVTDNRKLSYTKAQKEAQENNRRDITVAMMKNYPQLLRKFMADKDKVPSLVNIIVHLKLELYSLKRQEQNFKTVLQLIKDAFFKHGEKDPLRSCVNAMSFCSSESQGELQDFAQNKLKELEDELIVKLRSAMREVAEGDDEYSFLVNLKRLYELQLIKPVPIESLFEDFVITLRGSQNMEDEVVGFMLLNMYLHVAWCLKSIGDGENLSDISSSLLSKRNALFGLLESLLNIPSEEQEDGKYGTLLACRVITILAEMWCLFRKPNFSSTKLEQLGFCPDTSVLHKFWELCVQQLNNSDEMEDEDTNREYVEEINREVVMIAAAKLVAADTVPKDYLAPEIISHFVMHGTRVAEIVKQLIAVLKKTSNQDVSKIFLEALKRAYQRHVLELSKSDDESSSSESFKEFNELAARLSGTLIGAARSKHIVDIVQIVKGGVSFAFIDAPRKLSFLEGAVIHFVSKLPSSYALDILKDVQKRTENINTDEDPSGWRPYYTFVDTLREKYAKNEGFQDEKESVKRRGRPRKLRNIQGKKLFDGQGSSEEEDSISASDRGAQDEEEEHDPEEDVPLIHSLKSSSKLRSSRVSHEDSIGLTRNRDSA